MKVKEWKRRAELRGVKRVLRRLSRRAVPQLNGEKVLRGRVHGYVQREGRFGVDDTLIRAVDQVIDAQVIELKTDLVRQHSVEEVALGELEARLDGLVAMYNEEAHHEGDALDELKYQRYGARRQVEERDTPMPAGRGAAEEQGYQDGNVGDLVVMGRWGRLILYVVLLLAMVADLITFRQVVERVANDTAVFPLVLAMTVTTTWVAHRAGEAFSATVRGLARDFRRSVGGWTLLGTWSAMGLGLFFFRLLAPPEVGSGAADDWVNGGGGASSGDGFPVLNAGLLLLLYVITGAVAVTAGYQRPRPEIKQYQTADKRMRRTAPELSALRRDVAEAEALRRQLTDLRTGRAAQYEAEVGRCDAAATRVRAEAAMLTRRPVEPVWRRLFGRRRADRVEERHTARTTVTMEETIEHPATARFRHRPPATGRATPKPRPGVHDTAPGSGNVYRSAGAGPVNGRPPVDWPEADQDRGMRPAGAHLDEADTVRWTATAPGREPRADAGDDPDQPGGRRQLTDATE